MASARRLVLALGCALVPGFAASARAECRVEIAEAPADVRVAIEQWVAGESSCSAAIAIRVTEERGGRLALTATDRDGHVRARVVPDAQAAAALVVSWIADDPDLEPVALVEAAVEPAAIAPIGVDDEIPSQLATSIATTVDEATRTRHRTFAFGGLSDHGGRAQLDALRGSHWVIGIAGEVHTPQPPSPMPAGDVRRDAVVYLGSNIRIGRLHVRAQFGIGVEDTMVIGAPGETMTRRTTHRLAAHTETAVLAALPIAHGWGVLGGPVFARELGPDGARSTTVFVGAEHGL